MFCAFSLIWSILGFTAHALTASKAPQSIQGSALQCATNSAFSNSYFDSVLLKCQTCGTNTVPRLDYLGCKCAANSIQIAAQGAATTPANNFLSQFNPTCQLCTGTNSPSYDGTKCLDCSGATVMQDTISRKCICRKDGEILKESGTSYVCEACVNTKYWPPPRTVPQSVCRPCPQEGMTYQFIQSRLTKEGSWPCVCDQANGFREMGDKCISRVIAQNFPQVQITVNTGLTGSSVQSQTLSYLGLKALVGCQTYKQATECQLLANLCVLMQYNQQDLYCKTLLTLTKDSKRAQANTFYDNWGYREGLPWLYYLDKNGNPTPGNTVITPSAKRIKQKPSLSIHIPPKGIVNKLVFKLAMYNITGHFLGWETLDKQLFLCDPGQQYVPEFYKIGAIKEVNCTFDLAKLTYNKSLPAYSNVLFDMFVEDFQGELVDVPVYVQQAQTVQDGGIPETSAWVLVRRFFLFDTLMGISSPGTFQNQDKPVFVRYAKSIKLIVALHQNDPEVLNPPYLMIDYGSELTQNIERRLASRQATVGFRTQYTQGLDSFWRLSTTIFWIVFGVIFIITSVFMYIEGSAARLDSQQNNATTYYLIFKFTTKFFDLFSTLNFWVLFGLCCSWFVFFKFQSSIYCMMPVDYSLYQKSYDTILTLVLCFKFISLLYKIVFEQTSMDIFVVDWEPLRGYSRASSTKYVTRSVSPWRRLFLVNEFAELQTYTHIDFTFVLIAFMVVMEGFGIKNLATLQIGFSTEDKDIDIQSFPLTFVVVVLVIYGIGILNYIYTIFMAYFNLSPPPYLNFIDLCSVMNMSVMLFNEELKGYYVHGKSPSGSCDVDSKQLRLNLLKESSGNSTIRGLSNLYPDQQTFEMVLPVRLIEQYKAIILEKVISKVEDTKIQNQKNFNDVQKLIFSVSFRLMPENMQLRDLIQKQDHMNKLLKNYIEHVRADPKLFIREKSSFDNLLGQRPYPQADKPKGVGNAVSDSLQFPVMFNDNSHFPSFAKTLLAGLEWDILMMECLVIAAMDRARYVTSPPNHIMSGIALGTLMAFIIDNIMIGIRTGRGKAQIAIRTLVDDRKFLIT